MTQAKRSEADRERVLLEAMAEGVITADRSGRVTGMNPAAERLTGWSRDAAIGKSAGEVARLEAHDTNKPLDPVTECLDTGRPRKSRQPDVLRSTADPHPQHVRWQVLPDPDGVLLLLQDVTDQVLLADELAYRTRHDPLTGLLNREEFEHRLRAALADARADGDSYWLGYVDLDQFRLVNDTAGHFAGDEMLRELAAVLRARLREGDSLARLGGDEFGVLLHDSGPVPARDVVDALLEGVRGFSFEWDNRLHRLTASIGLTRVNARSVSVARVLREADSACQSAKDEGRDRVRLADTEVARRHGEMKLMGQFTEALEQNRFVLFAEDVVPVNEPGRVVYRELLVRLRDDRGRLLMPSTFIQAAERYFLITAMDRWVVRRALDHLSGRPDDGVIHALNLSGQSLADTKFLEYVLHELHASRISPRRLCLEITETSAISRLSQATRFIRRLSEAGVYFSLDDFGTGMASFSYLKNLPVNFLKIDGSFVHSMPESRVDRGMVEAINRIGHELGLRTIAEQVEDPRLLSSLAAIGVDWAQGRAIAEGRPLE